MRKSSSEYNEKYPSSRGARGELGNFLLKILKLACLKEI